ncbi:mandelate racemase/muconate lactonizing enzyme family protein [Gemmatimonadota bacterium]
MYNRRDFLASLLGTSLLIPGSCRKAPNETLNEDFSASLEKIAREKVLKLVGIKNPVTIESIRLLTDGEEYFVHTVSSEGAEGISITNIRARYLYPIFQELVVPFFIGKDARDLEQLIDGVYVHGGNYKLSSPALWCCVAWVEFSLLDMLGKISGKPLGELFGGVVRKEVPVYLASGRRETTPEEEAELLAQAVEEMGINAVKFKVGGRMSNNADSIPGRTEALIPLVRKRLGPGVAIHADSNGSYDPPKAIEVGKLLEEIDAIFFEEPCPFDHLEDTRTVADALEILVAGGEQESSERRFRWMIANEAVQVVQPDLHYYGGFIRAARVARMASYAGMPVTLHLSGEGTGYADMLHFCSFTPNIGPYQEYKRGVEDSGKWFDPPLKLHDGAISIPQGPGLGTSIDPQFISGLRQLEC